MGKGIILRVLEGTLLSPELSNALTKLIPGYKLEYFKGQPNYQQSIQRRIDSLHNAFLFILSAYPPDPKYTPLTIETLKTYAAECKAACDLTKDSLDELHKELERYSTQLIGVISTAWQWTEGRIIKESIAFLNEAEQYVLMTQGRPDLATLVPMQIGGKTEYILQLDESLPPYYDQWVNELREIKLQNYPKTPAWFRTLPEYQQAYFCSLSPTILNIKEIAQDLNAFIGTWKGIKTKSLNYTQELKQIENDSPPYPTWFNNLNPQIKAMVRVLSNSPAKFEKSLQEFKRMLINESPEPEFKNTATLIAKIPEWYWVLSDIQQCFLEHALKNANSIEEAVSFLSSRHRTLPAPANFAAHSLLRINSAGEFSTLGSKRWRSSHVASRDGLTWSSAVQQRHSTANFSKVTEQARPGQPILMQTLISPIRAVDYIPSVVFDYMPELPDLELFKIAQNTVARSSRATDTLQHNHPFNMAKYYYYTEINDSNSLALLKKARQFIGSKPGLEELLNSYQCVLESSAGSATVWDYVGRELFLSSLEQMIIHHIGGFSYGSCVSGKDRKAVELIHSDAMMLYKESFGCWPKFGDPKEERLAFVTLVVDLYCSRHQHEHAGQNAPGADGIKTPSWYFPNDIADAINKRLGTDKGLEYDDRLASDNEVRYINKHLRSNLLNQNEMLCKLMASQLGEENCTRLYDALSSLINEKRRFQKTTTEWSVTWFSEPKKENGSTPTGIKSILGVMQSETAGITNVQRLEQIFIAVLSRPRTDATRTEATNSVYNRIRALCEPCKVKEPLQKRVNLAVDEWKYLFEDSKEKNAHLEL